MKSIILLSILAFAFVLIILTPVLHITSHFSTSLAQNPSSCEDRLRVTQVQLNAATTSQIRERERLSHEIAGLIQQVERLQEQVKQASVKEPKK